MNKCNHIKRGILLIFWGILLVSLVQAQESKSLISSFSKSYPDYVVFLPEGKIDSVFYHAHSSIIPVIFKVNKYDLFPNKQLDSIVEVLSRVQKDASVRIAYLWIGGSASPEGLLNGTISWGSIVRKRWRNIYRKRQDFRRI